MKAISFSMFFSQVFSGMTAISLYTLIQLRHRYSQGKRFSAELPTCCLGKTGQHSAVEGRPSGSCGILDILASGLVSYSEYLVGSIF